MLTIIISAINTDVIEETIMRLLSAHINTHRYTYHTRDFSAARCDFSINHRAAERHSDISDRHVSPRTTDCESLAAQGYPTIRERWSGFQA